MPGTASSFARTSREISSWRALAVALVHQVHEHAAVADGAVVAGADGRVGLLDLRQVLDRPQHRAQPALGLGERGVGRRQEADAELALVVAWA